MVSPLKIESRREGADIGILSLVGEVDIATKESLREAAERLLAEGAKKLLVELSGVEYMDSAGLGVLKALRSQLLELGGVVVIVGARGSVAKLFETTRFDQAFPMYADPATALQEVGR